jgi:hypothetical protein
VREIVEREKRGEDSGGILVFYRIGDSGKKLEVGTQRDRSYYVGEGDYSRS